MTINLFRGIMLFILGGVIGANIVLYNFRNTLNQITNDAISPEWTYDLLNNCKWSIEGNDMQGIIRIHEVENLTVCEMKFKHEWTSQPFCNAINNTTKIAIDTFITPKKVGFIGKIASGDILYYSCFS